MSPCQPAAPPGEGRWRFKIPVLVSDLDLECKLWVKLRLAPMCPWIGTISLAFAGAPAVKVQLSPYNRVRLMRVPVLQVGGSRAVWPCRLTVYPVSAAQQQVHCSLKSVQVLRSPILLSYVAGLVRTLR